MRGSMRERRPGVWELRVFVGQDPVTGRERVQSRIFRGSRGDAESELAQQVSAQLDMRKVTPSAQRSATAQVSRSMSLSVLIEGYLAEHDGAPGTIAAYRGFAANHIATTIGPLPIGEIDAPLLERFYRFLVTERQMAGSSVRSVHALISGALRTAVRVGWLTTNVARDAKPPVAKRGEIVLPSSSTVADIIAAAGEQNVEFGLFVRLAAVTGARRGEICALRWTAIDLERAEIRIDHSLAIARGQLIEKGTKSHTERTVAIDTVTVDALRAHLGLQRERASAADMRLIVGGFLFAVDPTGETPWRPDSAGKQWDRLRAKLGLEQMRMHDLRHFQATMLLKAGMPVKNVSKRLGHRDATTTLNIYAQYLEEVDRESADVISRLLNGDS